MIHRRMLFAAPLVLAACEVRDADPTGEANAEMRALLEGMERSRGLSEVEPPRFREMPTLADAARARNPAPRHAMARVEDITIPTPMGDTLAARLHVPANGGEHPPLVLFLGDGDFVRATLDDPVAPALAAESGAMVLQVQPRLAPDHRMPMAHEDALSAWRWATRGAPLGNDPRRVALAGEGAGANLALATALAARDQSLPRPVSLALAYPTIGNEGETESRRRYAKARPAAAADMLRALRLASRGPRDLSDPRMDPARRANLAGLPRTLLVAAQIDPLLDESAALEAAMNAAGVSVRRMVAPGVTRGFLLAGAALHEARLAEREMGAELRAGFAAVREPVVASAPDGRIKGRATVARR